VAVEYGKALEEWNRLRFFAGLGGASLFVTRHETIGVDRRRTAFALANMAAKRQRLAEREPALPRKTMFDCATPEQQDVNAAVEAISRSVFRHSERRLRRSGAPRLNPGHTASLKFSDDLAGDFIIEVRPALSGARLNIMFGHRGSPRRAPRAFLAANNPSRQTRHGTLTLYVALPKHHGGDGNHRQRCLLRVRDGSLCRAR